MLFIGIDPKSKSYHVSPSFGCFNDEELVFIEESLINIWKMPYDLLVEKGIISDIDSEVYNEFKR